MIQDVDEALKRLVESELRRLPEAGALAEARVTFEAPEAAEAQAGEGARINFYLHDVRENTALRDESFAQERRPDGMAGRRRAPVRLDLPYIVTVYDGGDTRREHTLLSHVLGILLRHPAVAPEHLGGALVGRGPNALLLSVAQPDVASHASPPRLWQSMGGRLRPALGLIATTIFDPFETRWTRVVREAVLGVGQGTPPNGPRRPLDMGGVRVSVAGVVTDSQGKNPLPGVQVSVEERDETALTDERGFFCLLNLPPGPRLLRLGKRGFQEAEVRTVVPPPGRPDQLEPLVVPLEAASDAEASRQTTALTLAASDAPVLIEAGRSLSVSLSGTLRFEDGRAAAFIPVRVGSKRSSTDEHGTYCFLNLPPGHHEVVADVPGHGEVAARTKAGTSALAVSFAEASGKENKGARAK